jgi:hypothetical protein
MAIANPYLPIITININGLNLFIQKYKEIIREHYEWLYINKLDNLEEIDKFLESFSIWRLNNEEIENLNRPITTREIESIIKNIK